MPTQLQNPFKVNKIYTLMGMTGKKIQMSFWDLRGIII